jgi:hypothetical protein
MKRAPELGEPTGPAKTVEPGVIAQPFEHGWHFRLSGPGVAQHVAVRANRSQADLEERRALHERFKRRYRGEPVGGNERHPVRRRPAPFDPAVLADLAARAAAHEPMPAPARTPNWGKPLTWRNTDRDNCLRLAVHNAFGLPLSRIPARPSDPDDGWGDRFDAGLRSAGLHLELVPSRDLNVDRNERWVALIDGHAVAMIGMRVLHDSAQRWAQGERLDVPIVCGYVRKRAKTDRWGKVLAA